MTKPSLTDYLRQLHGRDLDLLYREAETYADTGILDTQSPLRWLVVDTHDLINNITDTQGMHLIMTQAAVWREVARRWRPTDQIVDHTIIDVSDR